MPIQNMLQTLFSLTITLTLIPGLWLAYRLVNHLSTIVPWLRPDPEGDLHWFHLCAWLVLGGLLSAPFVDLVLVIQGIDQLSPASILHSPSGQGQGFAYWTNILSQIQLIFTLLLTLIVYALVIRLLMAAYRSGKLAFLDQLGLERMDRIMLMLAFAAIADGVVRQFVMDIGLGFQLTTILGVPGLVAGLVLGLILFALVLNFLGQRLFNLEEQVEDAGQLHLP